MVKNVKAPITDGTFNTINYNFNSLSESHRRIQTQLNDLVLDAGKSDQEVAQARGGHQVLADRLNSVDSQLAQKAEESEVRMKTVPIGLNDAGSDLLAAIQNKEGETTFNILSEPKKESVTAIKTRFAKSKNLWDGTYINHALNGDMSGLLLRSDVGGNTAVVEVEKGKTYTITLSNVTPRLRIGASIGRPAIGYMLNRALHTDYGVTSVTVTVEGEEDYLVINVSSAEDNNNIPAWLQVEEGEEFTGYVEPNKVKVNFEDTSIPHRALDLKEVAGRNLFNGEYDGGRILGNMGEMQFYGSLGKSAVIKLEPHKTYTISKSRDTDRFRIGANVGRPEIGDFLSKPLKADDSPDPFTFTLGAEDFIIVNVSSSGENKLPLWLQVEEGEKATDHVETDALAINLDPLSFRNFPIDYLITDLPKGNYKTMSDYEPPNISDTGENILYDLYNEWDELEAHDPSYINKSLFFNDSTGLPSFRYDLKPLAPQKNIFNREYPKIIFIGGLHGHERYCNFEDLRFFKDLVYNWQSSDVLKMLRFNVHFIVIPVACPWGFAYNSRINSNGVNLNRNFEPGWRLAGEGTHDYSGPQPLSEIESQSLDQLLRENKDAIFAIDHHNYTTLTEAGHIAWTGCRDSRVNTLLFSLFNYMDGEVKSRFPWLLTENPDNATKNLFMLETSAHGGLAAQISEKYQIPGSLLETVFGWGSDYSGTYAPLQQFLVDLLGNLIATAVLKHQFIVNRNK